MNDGVNAKASSAQRVSNVCRPNCVSSVQLRHPSLSRSVAPCPACSAAIEDRNNRLELHSRNNQRLLGSLESLVGCLALSGQTEETLRYTNITTAK